MREVGKALCPPGEDLGEKQPLLGRGSTEPQLVEGLVLFSRDAHEVAEL